jgi:predicted PurR-regulated permease PerM
LTKPGILVIIYGMKKKMKKSWPVLMLLIVLLAFPSLSRAQNGFTQKDRDLLIQLNTRVNEMEKRFEQRFEQVDKRFAELREDMNKRFEQVDNRFGEMMTYIGILAAMFGAIPVGTISFALWDRRTMIRPFESKVAELDKKITDNKEKYESLIPVLKDFASKNKNFSDILKQYNLF